MHADKNETNSSRNSSPRTLFSTPNQNAFYLNFAPFPSHPCHRLCDTVTPPLPCGVSQPHAHGLESREKSSPLA